MQSTLESSRARSNLWHAPCYKATNVVNVARSMRAVAVLLAVLCLPVPAVLAGQAPGVTATSAQTPPPDPEAQGDGVAPVLVGGTRLSG